MNTVLIVVGLLSGLLGALYALYQKYQQALQKVAEFEAKNQVRNNLDKIAEQLKNVKETEIDFDRLVEEFNRNNPRK